MRISNEPSYILTERGRLARSLSRGPLPSRSTAIDNHSNPNRLRKWFWAGGVVLIALAGWYGVNAWRGQAFDWQRFASTFQTLHPGYLAGAVICALSTYFGRALRWAVLIRSQSPHPNLWKLFVATAVGFTAIVLFGRPGEMVRPYLIAKAERLSFTSQLGAWFIERIYDLLMALFIFAFALSQARSIPLKGASAELKWVMEVGGFAALGLTVVSAGLLFVFGRYASAMERRLHDALQVLPDRWRFRISSMAGTFVRSVESCQNPTSILKLAGYSVLEWVLIIASYYLIFLAVPRTAEFTILQIAIFVGFVSFGNVIQIPGVGGGLQIVSVLVLTQLFGLTLETASGIALILWAVTFLVIVPIGILLALHEGIRIGKLRVVGEELSHQLEENKGEM